MTDPLLSIIIPTKDRYDTLIPVVDSFLNHIVGSDYEIVVQDNSGDNSRWLQYAKSGQDEKVKYFHDAIPVPIKDNTNRAFEHSRGQYLIFIGDDDFVSPYILDVVNMMRERNVENLIYPCAYYWWNSVEFASSGNYYHRKEAFWMPKKIDTTLQEKNAKKELCKVLNNGAVRCQNLPRIYHGLVKKEVLERIKSKTGVYLVGSSPDMSFCVSAALVLDKYYYTNYPVSVAGGSKNSGTGWGARRVHYSKLEDLTHLPKNIHAIWNKNIPRYWSAMTIWSQSAHETLQAFHSSLNINFISFYASVVAYEKPLIWKIFPLLFKYAKFNVFKYIKFISITVIRFAGRVIRKCRFESKKAPFIVSIHGSAAGVMRFLQGYPYDKTAL
jgi:glycosyltransferase involved in cell wall biosynthesis